MHKWTPHYFCFEVVLTQSNWKNVFGYNEQLNSMAKQNPSSIGM